MIFGSWKYTDIRAYIRYFAEICCLEGFNQQNPYIFIAWIIDPHAPLGKEGLVKLSKNKELKVMQILQNIELLLLIHNHF